MSLVEICCVCGFVHRDDRIQHRARKAHYHWTPRIGETVCNGIMLHATVCAECCDEHTRVVDWRVFYEARAATPPQYIVMFALNAALPEMYRARCDELYALFSSAFVFDHVLTELRVPALTSSTA
jgi:hypothetical protein